MVHSPVHSSPLNIVFAYMFSGLVTLCLSRSPLKPDLDVDRQQRTVAGGLARMWEKGW